METISSQKETKAIKIHRCDFCGEKIEVGQGYLKSTHKYDGEVYDWKTHKQCSDLADKLNMYEDADEGVTGDMFQETVSNFHDDILIEQLPKDEGRKYSDIIQQLRHVRWRDKLFFVMRHLNKQAPPIHQSNPG